MRRIAVTPVAMFFAAIILIFVVVATGQDKKPEKKPTLLTISLDSLDQRVSEIKSERDDLATKISNSEKWLEMAKKRLSEIDVVLNTIASIKQDTTIRYHGKPKD